MGTVLDEEGWDDWEGSEWEISFARYGDPNLKKKPNDEIPKITTKKYYDE